MFTIGLRQCLSLLLCRFTGVVVLIDGVKTNSEHQTPNFIIVVPDLSLW